MPRSSRAWVATSADAGPTYVFGKRSGAPRNNSDKEDLWSRPSRVPADLLGGCRRPGGVVLYGRPVTGTTTEATDLPAGCIRPRETGRNDRHPGQSGRIGTRRPDVAADDPRRRDGCGLVPGGS